MFRNLKLVFGKIQHAKSFSCGRQYLQSLREPSQPLKRCPKWVCVEDAIKIINSGIVALYFKTNIYFIFYTEKNCFSKNIFN